MKEKLQHILEENRGTIKEAVITEILKEEHPESFLLYIHMNGTEWWIIKCLEFEKDTTKFFNKHYLEIEALRKYMQQYNNNAEIPKWYTVKHYYANEAFKYVAFELYMQLVIDEL